MHLDAMNVSMENGRVVANARASLFDRRNDVAYVWNLAAIDESTRETVAQKLYKDQIFDFAGGRNAHPTFSDGLDLPAGRYRVMLTLYEVPRNTGFDIDSLKDREKSKGQRVLVGVGKIEVP